jgi:signal-transduction protein with cAMP-binding, CBS, and nucleotidyltransferase domain
LADANEECLCGEDADQNWDIASMIDAKQSVLVMAANGDAIVLMLKIESRERKQTEEVTMFACYIKKERLRAEYRQKEGMKQLESRKSNVKILKHIHGCNDHERSSRFKC